MLRTLIRGRIHHYSNSRHPTLRQLRLVMPEPLRILNRIIRGGKNGIEYEADPRQCERLLESLQLSDDCNGAATPGIKPLPAQIEAEEQLCSLVTKSIYILTSKT